MQFYAYIKIFQLVDHLVLKEANVEAYCHHSW